jgi:hypothetical protein
MTTRITHQAHLFTPGKDVIDGVCTSFSKQGVPELHSEKQRPSMAVGMSLHGVSLNKAWFHI